MKELRDFVRWAINEKFTDKPDCVEGYPDLGVVFERVYRKDNFQIERVIIEPHAMIRSHAHPDIDSWEIWLAGSGLVTIGKHVASMKRDGYRPSLVQHNVWHGGEIFEKGAMWLSVQQWLNGQVPTSVIKNWIEDDRS